MRLFAARTRPPQPVPTVQAMLAPSDAVGFVEPRRGAPSPRGFPRRLRMLQLLDHHPTRRWSIVRFALCLLLTLGVASAGMLPGAQAQPAAPPAQADTRVSPLAYRTDLQGIRSPDGHPI